MSEQYYSRKCDVCNKGMEEGFLLAGFEYACSKECLEKMPNYSWKTYLEDNAIDGDNTYYTSWEQDWNSEETLFLADGTEVDNPFFESDLELLRSRHNEGGDIMKKKIYKVGIALWQEHEIEATSEKEALEIAEEIEDTGMGDIVNRTCEIWNSPDKEEVTS